MNKKSIVLTLALLFIMSGFNIANAEDKAINTTSQVKGNIQAQGEFSRPERPAFDESFKDRGRMDFDAPPPPHGQFQGRHPSKEEMEAKKAEIDKRLNLTDKQKKQIELNKQQDQQKIKPIMENIQAKKKEFRTIMDDESLSQAEKDKKIKEVRDNLRELKGQADSIRKDNMNNFENILNDKQKKEFSKIKEEQKKEMEQRKKEFEKTVVPPQKK